MNGRGRRLLVLVASLALAAGCVQGSQDATVRGPTDPTGSSTTGPVATTAPPGPLGDWELSDWGPCADAAAADQGFECAELEVPLDWADTDGATIALSVTRRPADDPAARVGSVLFNFGGPGDPGAQTLPQFVAADRVPADLGASFDLVSWDPRGTGASAGVRCLTDEQLAAPDADPTIDSPADVAAIDATARRQLASCDQQTAGVIPMVGTRNTVRDLDALRAALGDEALTYVGYSYGTTVGVEYLQLFPDSVRAMVLDGVSLPGGDPVEDTHAQARSFEANFDAFLDGCADRLCGFGDGDPRAVWAALVARLEGGERIPADYTLPDEQGVPHRRRGTVGTGELYLAVITALYGEETWPALELGLASAESGDGAILLSLRDSYVGRGLDGTWSHIGEANGAINCADQELRPPDADGDDALRTAWSQELPLLGSAFATGTPGCFGYPAAREPLAEPTSFEPVPPVVVIGATGDPATPYQASVDLAEQLDGAMLATWEAADHTAYGRGSACLDDPVTAYLVSGEAIPDGLTCEP